MQRVPVLYRSQHIPAPKPMPARRWILHKHGEVSKSVKDIYMDEVAAMRYRCVDCKREFTRFPPDVDRSEHSIRLRAVMSLMWALGLSHRSVGCVLTALGYLASRMSSWRAVQ